MLFRSRRAVFLTAVSILASGFLVGAIVLLYFIDPFEESKIATSRMRGDKVVVALQEYHKKHRVYPEELRKLVPEFLAKVEPPTFGTKAWRYVPSKTFDSFTLYFEQHGRYPCCYFQSSDSKWHSDF